ncbi:MAG: hypothetical protein A2161_19800 [Candidatus Schekmanbacteria bacterium RBG_13_48_7]|uniref:Leucyl aminopeptidase n=1 Tax=Candidatus Schekmanbacteria bacterium RBG_13_48_7 TaxID=1817878 RepID=A0A1F7S308_9BACT|nr:MAG: hypothetical protein A2161_19800 [Candidatus Schekmanbacteria bacterium RBG_13_48_7]
MSEIKTKKFVLTNAIPSELEKAARITVNKVLAVKPGERVLIMSNPYPDLISIAESLFNCCVDAGSDPLLCYQSARKKTEFCSSGLISAMESEPHVLMSISRDSLGQDPKGLRTPYLVGDNRIDHIFKYLMAAKKTRTMWAPNVTAEMYAKTVPIDYDTMWEKSREIKKNLDEAEFIHVTSPAGSDFVIVVKNRIAALDDGYYCEAGLGGNLPAGEVMISPALDSSFGKIVIDGSMGMNSETVITVNPIILNIKNGVIQSIEGEQEARNLDNTLKNALEKTKEYVKNGIISAKDQDEYLKNVYHIGEFGIGVNPDAEIVGMMIEDEKALHTCHVAIGDNYDLDARAILHLDGLIKNPTITAIDPVGRKKRICIE